MSNICYITLFLFYIINFMSNLMDWIEGSGEFFQPLYSVMHFCFVIPFGMLILSKSFRCLAGIKTERTLYKWGEIVLLICALLAFFLKFLCYHSIFYVMGEMKESGTLDFMLGLLEITMLSINILFRSLIFFSIIFRYKPEQN